MPRRNYVNISVPSDIINEIDACLRQNQRGYRSRAEFVLDAIRTHIREVFRK
jgi:metal-responsive CopG/Arc/MetJ family transcriptional regulator